MVRVISQETYDEVVRENMDDFELSPEEAIREAVAQFEAQGVDLSNIIKDLVLSSDNHKVSNIVGNLKEKCSKSPAEDEDILKALDELREECSIDIARRIRAGKDGAYGILLDLLDSRYQGYSAKANERDEKMIIAVLNTLIGLMDKQPDLLDQWGADMIKNLLDKTDSEAILEPLLQWTSLCCVKHEMNKQMIFAKNIIDNLKRIIVKPRENFTVTSECMQVIRRFTLDDDVRVEFGKAHDHTKELGFKLLEPLTQLLREYAQKVEVSEIMLTMAALLVRSELCEMACDAGADKTLFTILADNYDCAPVIIDACKLITALAGNDEVKKKLIKAGIAPVIVTLLNRHKGKPVAAALLLKCISALTLREPEHSWQFYHSGAPEAMVDAIGLHPTNAAVQRNGCWALRNMVARCREQNAKFHELGVETVLNATHQRFGQSFGFDIKSALRDLECDVKLDEQWHGTGVEIENN